MSLEPREPLATWLDSRARPYRVAELRDQWTEWSIRSAVNRGAAVRLLPGIIAGAAHAQEPRVRALALALWHPSLHVTGAATLHLLGVAVAFQWPTQWFRTARASRRATGCACHSGPLSDQVSVRTGCDA